MVPDCIKSVPNKEWQLIINKVVNTVCLHRPVRHDAMASREDLEQQAWLALYGAGRRFDPTMGTKITTFAFSSIYRELCRFIDRANVKSMPQIEPMMVSGIAVTHTQCDTELTSMAMSTLSPMDQQIVMAHVGEGLTFREMGKRFNKNWTSVSKRYYRAMERLQYEGARISRVQGLSPEVCSE